MEDGRIPIQTSGVGWIAEVLAEVYIHCKEEGGDNCDSYREASKKAIWWVYNRTYLSKDSLRDLPNPDRAIGGIYWNKSEKHVRTDSVCHGLNAYLYILDDLEDGPIVTVYDKK